MGCASSVAASPQPPHPATSIVPTPVATSHPPDKEVKPAAAPTPSSASATDDPADNPDVVALLRFVKQGNLDKVQSALAATPALLNARGMWDSTPLLVACQYAHSAAAAHLLSLGADIALVNEKHVSAVLLAALEGMTGVLQRLLAAPRDLVAPLLTLRGTVYNSFTDKNAALTPLLAACTNGHVECVRLLVEAVDASERSSHLNGQTNDMASSSVLLAAARHGHTAVLALLLQYGVTASVCDSDGNNAVLLALAGGFDATAVAVIQAAPATATAVNAEKLTPLHVAARVGCAGTVDLLLATPSLAASLVNGANAKGETALLLAARKKHVRIVETLVRAGANVDACDATGQSARQVLVKTKQDYLLAVVEAAALPPVLSVDSVSSAPDEASTMEPPPPSPADRAKSPSPRIGHRRRSSRRKPFGDGASTSFDANASTMRRKGSHRSSVTSTPDNGENSPLTVGRRTKPGRKRRSSSGNLALSLDQLDGLVASASSDSDTPASQGGAATADARCSPGRRLHAVSKSCDNLTTSTSAMSSRCASMQMFQTSKVHPNSHKLEPLPAAKSSAVAPWTRVETANAPLVLPTTPSGDVHSAQAHSSTSSPPLPATPTTPDATKRPLNSTNEAPVLAPTEPAPSHAKASSNHDHVRDIKSHDAVGDDAAEAALRVASLVSPRAMELPPSMPSSALSADQAGDSSLPPDRRVNRKPSRGVHTSRNSVRRESSHGGIVQQAQVMAGCHVITPIQTSKSKRNHRSASVLVSPSTLDAIDRIGDAAPKDTESRTPTACQNTSPPKIQKRAKSCNSVEKLHNVDQAAFGRRRRSVQEPLSAAANDTTRVELPK